MIDLNPKDWSIKNKTIVVFTTIVTYTLVSVLLILFLNSRLKTADAQVDLTQNCVIINNHISALIEVIDGDNQDNTQKAKEEIKLSYDDLDSAYNTLKTGGMYEFHGDLMYLPPVQNEEIQYFLTEMSDEYISHKKNALFILNENRFLDVRDSNNIENRIVNPKFAFSFDTLQNNLIKKTLQDKFSSLSDLVYKEKVKSKSQFSLLIVFIGVSELVLLFIGYFFLERLVSAPLLVIGNQVKEIAEGNSSMLIEYNGDDEIGLIAKNINNLRQELKSATDFTVQITNGDFSHDLAINKHEQMKEDEHLGLSLLKLRDSLKKAAEEDKIRAWNAEGLAIFVEILKNQTLPLQTISDNFVRALVRYIHANQAALFVMDNSNQYDEHLELISCYAWEKKRYINKRVDKKEGLVGQVWVEGKFVYLTEVPSNYTVITSGVGDASPTCILLMPLIVNDVIYGVLEIASFHLLEKQQIDFVQKIAENFAATISTVKSTEITKKLLAQSQEQTETMRAQEEEMRQNLEEMIATQEEAERKALNYERRIAELEEQLRAVKG